MLPKTLQSLAAGAALALSLSPALLGASRAFAFGEPNNSKLEATATPDGANLTFKFQVKANAGHVVTLDAPWKLEVTNADGLTFAKSSLGKSEMDDKLPGFVLTTSAAPAKPAGDLEYSLTSFICTENKTACYREVHKGKLPWKVAGK